jgi:hypothetical protein
MRRSVVEKERRLMVVWRARMDAVVETLRVLYTQQRKLDKVLGRLKKLRDNVGVGGKYEDEVNLGSRRLANARKRSKASAR